MAVVTRSVTEGLPAVFAVSLASAPAETIDVAYGPGPGSAAGSEYVRRGSSVRFWPDGPRTREVHVETYDDLADEPVGTISLQLRTPAADAGYTLGSRSVSGAVSIADDDRPAPRASITADARTVAEGRYAWFTISLSGDPSGMVDVAYQSDTSASTATAGSDYSRVSGEVRFYPGGPRSRKIWLRTRDNYRDEPDKTVSLTLADLDPAADAGYTLNTARQTATVTIADDDRPGPQASIAATTPTVTEGGYAWYAVTLSASPARTVSVAYARDPAASTAAAGNDYTAPPGTVTFYPGGPRTRHVLVATRGNQLDAPDKTLTLKLTDPANAAGYTLAPNGQTATVTIADDDQPGPQASIAATTSAVHEGQTAWYAITVNRLPTRSIDVAYGPGAATGAGHATPGTDFDRTQGWLRFTPGGPRTRHVAVRTIADRADETAETVTLKLTGPRTTAGYTLNASNSATGVRLTDSGPLPAATLSHTGALDLAEGQTKQLTVTLAPPVGRTTVVPYTATGTGTLTTDDYTLTTNDYTQPTARQITFRPWQTTRTIAVTARFDTRAETPETLTLALATPAADARYQLGTSHTRQLRLTNSTAPAAAIAASSAPAYPGGQAQYTIQLTPTPVEATTISYTLSGTGYTTPARTTVTVHPAPTGPASFFDSLSYTPGQATIAVPVAATATKGNEITVTLTANQGQPYTIANPPPTATITVKTPPEASLKEHTSPKGPAFEVALTGEIKTITTVRYQVTGGVDRTGSVIFKPGGKTTQPVVLEGTGNVKDVTVRLEPGLPEYTLGDPSSLDLGDYARPVIEVQAIEVTQGTQDWQNSVQLVADRATAVRVFFTTSDPREVEVTARLRGKLAKSFANGTSTTAELGDPEDPLFSRESQIAGGDEAGSVVVYAALDGKGKPLAAQQVARVCEPDTVAARSRCRGDVDSSLNFVLPDSWVAPVVDLSYQDRITATGTTVPGPTAPPRPRLEGSAVTLQLVGFPSHVQVVCSEAFTALAKASCPGGTPSVQVSFTEVKTPRIVLANVDLRTVPSGRDTMDDPSPCGETIGAIDDHCGDLREQYERIHSLLPLRTVGRGFGTGNVTRIEAFNIALQQPGEACAGNDGDCEATNSGLLKKIAQGLEDERKASRKTRGHSDKTHLYGAVISKKVPSGGIGGRGGFDNNLSTTNYDTAVWYTDGKGKKGQTGRQMNTGPHEVVHAMGQRHTSLDGQVGFCGEKASRKGRDDYADEVPVSALGLKGLASYATAKQDVQSHAGPIDYPVFDFLNGQKLGLHDSDPANEATDDANMVPTLGPVGDPYAEVWGLDLRYLAGRVARKPDRADGQPGPATGLAAGRDKLVASNPRFVFELMSYCGLEGKSLAGYQYRWLGRHYHAKLVDYMNNKVK